MGRVVPTGRRHYHDQRPPGDRIPGRGGSGEPVVIKAKRSPGDGCHFRIILLKDPPRNGLPDMVHRKTAICVPAQGSGRRVHRIIGEITAAKQAAYLTRRDVYAAAINSAFRERRHDLETQLISEEAVRFSNGVICVRDGPGPDPEAVFIGGDPARWMNVLAGWLLARSDASLPLDTQGIAQPICEADAGSLFSSIFSQTGADPDLLYGLGPAMGLSLRKSGGPYDPSQCRVFPLIRERIGSRPADFDDVHQYLAYDIGLQDQLASLYLLLFIRHECPEHQIQLKDDAEMFLADGGALLGARLTSDLIPLLSWDPQLASKAASIGPASAPHFIDARHHLSILCPEVASIGADMVDETLIRSLESKARDIRTASNVLESLEACWDAGINAMGPAGETGKIRAALERLELITGSGYADIYHSIRAAYPALPKLTDDLGTLQKLVNLDDDTVEIFQVQRYLTNAQAPGSRLHG